METLEKKFVLFSPPWKSVKIYFSEKGVLDSDLFDVLSLKTLPNLYIPLRKNLHLIDPLFTKVLNDPKATIYSQDDDKGLSGRIREKKKISLKEFFQLFFSRRSSFNLYSRMLLVLLYTPFPQKIYTLFKILLNVPYVFFKKVL